MKILLAVDASSNPVAVGNYLLQRLGPRPVNIEVLTVIPGIEEQDDDYPVRHESIISIAEGAQEYQRGCALVAAVAAQLQACGFASVRTHVEYGDPAEVLLGSSRQWRCDLVLIGAPRRKGVLTALQLDGVTRRLLRWCDSPVELMRPFTAESAHRSTVLVPLPIEAMKRFPLHALQALPWCHGSRLHLLGVQPESVDASLAEASPAALLLALQHTRDAGAKALAALAACARELETAGQGRLTVTHDMVEGSLREACGVAFQALQPQLVVLGAACFDQNTKALFGALSPATLALSAPCSVLMLQDEPTTAPALRRQETAHILKLAR